MSIKSTLTERELENYNMPIGKEYEKIPKNKSLYLCGRAGSGKTSLVLQLARELEEKYREINIEFIKFQKLIKMARKTYSQEYRDRQDSDSIIRTCKQCDLLILDDLGSESSTNYSQEIFYEIIDYRYNRMKPIFITSNLSFEQLSEVYHNRLLSRIKAICQVVKMKDVDHRLQDTNKEFNFSHLKKPKVNQFTYFEEIEEKATKVSKESLEIVAKARKEANLKSIYKKDEIDEHPDFRFKDGYNPNG